MNQTMTLSLAGAFLAIAVFAGWRGARPSDPIKGARMMPWRPIMVGSAALCLFMLVHLANLFGVTTGR